MRAPASSKNHAPKIAAGIMSSPPMRGKISARSVRTSTGVAKSMTGAMSDALALSLRMCINANQTQNPPQTTVSSDAPQLSTGSGIAIRGLGKRGKGMASVYLGFA